MSKFKHIPIDDISLVYAEVSAETRSAVSFLLTADSHIATTSDEEGNISISWRASPGVAIAMLAGAISTGTREFGEIWLNGLMEYLPSNHKN